jgi:UDP:flavonoid glycosyltransferase YjiC (YdhE family)
MKFLLTTLPTNDLGLMTRSLPIARELTARGHAVAFSNPAPAPSKLIAEGHFTNIPPKHPLHDLVVIDRTIGELFRMLRTRPWRRSDMSPLTYLRSVASAIPIRFPPTSADIWDADHAGAMMGMLNEGFIRANVDAYTSVIKAFNPDAVVDFWNPFAAIAARRLGKKLATVIQADAHPSSQGFLWWRPKPRGTPSPIATVNRVIESYGISPLNKLADLNVGDITLCVGTPELDPIPESTGVEYIGAVLWEVDNASLPHWIEAFPTDRPVIWVYSGNPKYGSRDTTLDSIVVLEACLTALVGVDAAIVLTTGHHELPNKLSPLPPNFYHAKYVPGLSMARRADLLIHHGGYGSCQTSLWMGKPSVIIPTFSERLSNAKRLERAGAAILVEPTIVRGWKKVRPDELRRAVVAALSDPCYRHNARLVGKSLASFGGAKRAADHIEALGKQAPRPSNNLCDSGRADVGHNSCLSQRT